MTPVTASWMTMLSSTGRRVTGRMAFVKSPDGISIELLQKARPCRLKSRGLPCPTRGAGKSKTVPSHKANGGKPVPNYVSVAFHLRAPRLFDYAVCENTPKNLIGRRVLAPLAGKQTVGLIINQREKTAVSSEKIKTLIKVFDDTPPLPEKTMALIQFCADYYHCPVGLAAAAALPRFFRRAGICRPPGGYRLCNDFINRRHAAKNRGQLLNCWKAAALSPPPTSAATFPTPPPNYAVCWRKKSSNAPICGIARPPLTAIILPRRD